MKKIILLFSIAIFLVISSNVSAVSNQSIEAESLLVKAESCLNQMIKFNLPITRANNSYQEANNLYLGQITLEKSGRFVNYEKINELSADVCIIKDSAIKASDELIIFLDTYERASNEVNLSDIYEDIVKTNNSFYEERFEDTLTLIDEGYTKISDSQAKQTAVNAFYTATSNTIKNFIIKNWIILLIVLSVGTIAVIYFWKTIRRYFLKEKMEHLSVQKETINSLIKKLQKDYFSTKTISESEFFTKINKYKDMLLDIERQIPLLKEDLEKVREKEEKISLKKEKEALKREKTIKQSIRRTENVKKRKKR